RRTANSTGREYEPKSRKCLAMPIPVATPHGFRSRLRSVFRFRPGSLLILLALGWPMILAGILSLIPGYVEFEFNSLVALVWIWLPSAVMLLVGLLVRFAPGLRERRVPFPFTGIVTALIVSGALRVAYERGLDLTVRALFMGSRAAPALIDVLAAETARSRVAVRSSAATDGLA